MKDSRGSHGTYIHLDDPPFVYLLWLLVVVGAKPRQWPLWWSGGVPGSNVRKSQEWTTDVKRKSKIPFKNRQVEQTPALWKKTEQLEISFFLAKVWRDYGKIMQIETSVLILGRIKGTCIRPRIFLRWMFFPQDFSPIFGFGRKKHLTFFWAGDDFVFPASTRFYRGKKTWGWETKKVMKRPRRWWRYWDFQGK